MQTQDIGSCPRQVENADEEVALREVEVRCVDKMQSTHPKSAPIIKVTQLVHYGRQANGLTVLGCEQDVHKFNSCVASRFIQIVFQCHLEYCIEEQAGQWIALLRSPLHLSLSLSVEIVPFCSAYNLLRKSIPHFSSDAHKDWWHVESNAFMKSTVATHILMPHS